jgi:hypothetical protein
MMRSLLLFSDGGLERLKLAAQANSRGIRLLTQNLSPAQRADYAKHKYFNVVGGSTGRRYRITNRSSMNVYLLDNNGLAQCLLCFLPQGTHVLGDILLAQKLALELFESEAIRVFRVFPHDHPLLYSDPMFEHRRGLSNSKLKQSPHDTSISTAVLILILIAARKGLFG